MRDLFELINNQIISDKEKYLNHLNYKSKQFLPISNKLEIEDKINYK